MEPVMKVYFALIALMFAGCVNMDPETGATLPRRGQKYKFKTVERKVDQLKIGMKRVEVLILLGSPAQSSDDGDIWVYLPERPAVLIPSRALRVEFENNVLVKHSYSAIVLGQQL